MYNPAEVITIDDILEKGTLLDIFACYIHNFPGPYIKFSSQIRPPTNPDNTPSSVIYQHKQTWLYRDFGTGEILNPFDYASHIESSHLGHKPGHAELLGLILSKMGSKPSYQIIPKLSCEIYPTIRPFEGMDDEFWSQFNITRANLIRFKVLPLSSYFLIKGRSIRSINCLKYPVYSIEEGDNRRRKIYNPLNPLENKWSSTDIGDWIMGYKQLPASGDLLVVTKSMKDVIAWSNFGIPAISWHNESQQPQQNTVGELKNRFKRTIINYDNDPTGKLNGHKFAKKFGWTEYYTPNHKDLSDWIKLCKNLTLKDLNLPL